MRVAIIALGLSLLGARAYGAGVTWQEGPLTAALAQAQVEKKWVFIDIFATWCAPCQQMDAEVYPREEVARALAAGYVPLRRDGEVGEGQEIAKRYHVVGFPTLLVLDDKGVEVDRLTGSASTTELILQLARLREGKGTLAELEHGLELAPSDSVRLEVGTRHAMRGDARAIAELSAVVDADADNQAKRAAPALLTLGKYYYLRAANDYARAEGTLLELERRFPQSREAAEAPYHRALAQLRLGRAKDMRVTLDAWIERAPKDVERLAAYAWFCFKESGDRARGIEIAQRGLALAPKDDALWDTLGELYAASGNAVEARKAFAAAVALRPKNDYYQRQLRKVGGVP